MNYIEFRKEMSDDFYNRFQTLCDSEKIFQPSK